MSNDEPILEPYKRERQGEGEAEGISYLPLFGDCINSSLTRHPDQSIPGNRLARSLVIGSTEEVSSRGTSDPK